MRGDDRLRERCAPPHRPETGLPASDLLIIQITTVGNEETVNEIIRRIRGYQLGIPSRDLDRDRAVGDGDVPGADELIVVPKDFECRASYKARALEYTRRCAPTDD